MIKKLIAIPLFILMLALTLACSCGKAKYIPCDYAQVYVTTGTMSELMQRQSSLKFGKQDANSLNTTVTVNTGKTYQSFYGHGAALTHSSAYLLMQSGAEEIRAEILGELFGGQGARLNMVRVPIGSSDYTEGDVFYSCCDISDPYGEDAALENFSVAKDANIIAVLKEIEAINPDIKIIACPWSAPAWMKESHTLIGGALNSAYNSLYAEYLIKFLEAYKAQGIDVEYISLVNEPYITNVQYPSMQMDGLQAAEISIELGRKIAEKKLGVQIFTWDHNVDYVAEDWFAEVFDNPEANKYVNGVAFHGYVRTEDGDIFTGCDYVNGRYPGKEIFITEITEHSGSNDFASNLAYAAQYVTAAPVNSGVSAGMFWNFVLTPEGEPTPVPHTTACYGVIDLKKTSDGFEYDKRSAYYAMAHVSKFAYAVNGGYAKALRVESSNDTQILGCALLRADGAIVVTVVNISDRISENVDVVINGRSVTCGLAPQSVVTLVC